MPPRREEAVRQLPVVCQQKQSLRVLVETPDRRKIAPCSRGKKIQHRPLTRILRRADHTGRLIHHVIFHGMPDDRLPLIFHAILRSDRGVGLFHRNAIHKNSTGPDCLLQAAPGSDAHIRKIPVKPHID